MANLNVKLKNQNGDILYPQTRIGNLLDDAGSVVDVATQDELNTLSGQVVKKTGQSSQTIAGNITIQGNLTVNGSTITESTESLTVKDNMIVTNSEGAELSGLSGLFIRTDTSGNGYAIVYDPSTNTVILGEGTIDGDNEVTVSSAERKAITTRADSSNITNNHLLSWNDALKVLEDSGVDKSVISTIQTNLTNHINNKSNPHGVTASQVGAYSKSEVDTKLEGFQSNIIVDCTIQDLGIGSTGLQNKISNYVNDNKYFVLRVINGDETRYVVPLQLNVSTDEGIKSVLITAAMNSTGDDNDILMYVLDDGLKVESISQVKNSLKQLINAKYTKPSTGIPESDLASAVQASLNKADTALQSVPDATTSVKGIALLGASGGSARYGQKADVGLGSVVNTGDSATPVSGGTTKFTTGGAYTMQQALQTNINGKQATLVSGTNIKTVNGQSILGSGDLSIGEGITYEEV